jgi:hypothetical protein
MPAHAGIFVCACATGSTKPPAASQVELLLTHSFIHSFVRSVTGLTIVRALKFRLQVKKLIQQPDFLIGLHLPGLTR